MMWIESHGPVALISIKNMNEEADINSYLFNNIKLPHESKAVYLWIHLDRRLTCRNHIEAKKVQIKLKTIQLNWVIGSHSKLSNDNKVPIYKSILKQIWTYGIQLIYKNLKH